MRFLRHFKRALDERRMVRLHFYSKKEGGIAVRRCAPLDFGPSDKARDGHDRYHFWNVDSPNGPHVISLLEDQIDALEVLEETFDPKKIVTWVPRWKMARAW